MSIKVRKEYLFILVALLLVLTLAACEPAEEPGAVETPILGVETPILDETPVVVETPIVEETPAVIETPVVEETPIVEETPMVEETPVIEETPVVEETPAVTEVAPETANIIRSSTLIGMTMVTPDGEEVGEVSDILIDTQGNIQYIVFDTGGFLDTDARTALVEWQLFEFDPERTGPTIADATAADTPEAGTPEAGTPTVSAPAVSTPGVGAQVGVTTEDRVLIFTGDTTDLEAAPELDTGIWDDNVIVNAEELDLPAEFDGLIRVGQLGGFLFAYNLVNTQGEDLGDISELVLDLAQGRVLYAIADVGGFLGIGANQISIPWEQLEFDRENENFVLDADQETLENAPTVDFADWDDGRPADADWDTEIDSFWQTAP